MSDLPGLKPDDFDVLGIEGERQEGPDNEARSNGENKPRRRLLRFDEITFSTERDYLIKGLLPKNSLVCAWGPPKCGKSFWFLDILFHVAWGWPYRERRVVAGPVVYVAAEMPNDLGKRLAALRQHYQTDGQTPAPFYAWQSMLDLIGDYDTLVHEIAAELGGVSPAAICMDTLARTIQGPDKLAENMGPYIKACDRLRQRFRCTVALIHHCGWDDKRLRGATELPGALDLEIAIYRDTAGNVIAETKNARAGPDGDSIISRLEQVDVGTDADGDPISSCVVVAAEAAAEDAHHDGPRLSANQRTMLTILQQAMPRGLTVEDWNDQAREAGLGAKRKQDLYDLRTALKDKHLVHTTADRWFVTMRPD